ncbi:MAG: hypothetical protein GX786_00925 [Clostridiales bacterium]|nr:hypothetical protein [Clostridiales bacterium]
MFTRLSKVKEVTKFPEIIAIAQQRAGVKFPSIAIKMAGNLSLEQLGKRFGFTQEEIDGFIEQINEQVEKLKQEKNNSGSKKSEME